MPARSRGTIIKQAKKKIKSLISRGFNINVSKASPFTQILIDQRRRARVAGLTGQAKLGGSFDGSSQGATKAKGKFK